MDLKLKTITWVGKNISQKFETMCQEVDNIVSQDTVRYVENQMQTMGDSMKKFCSDVVQDFLPPSVDPVRHEAQEPALKKNAVIGTYLKSIIGIQENSVDVFTNQSPVEPDAVDPETNKIGKELSGLNLGNQLISTISDNPSVRSESDLDSGQIDDVLAHETSDVNNEKNSLKENSSTSWVLESISCGEKDSSKASPMSKSADCNQKNACCYVSEVSSVTSVCVVECQSAQKMSWVSDKFLSVSDSSNASAASEVAFSVVSSEEKVSETGLMSSTNSQLMGSNRLHKNSPENFDTKSVCCNDPVDKIWSVSDCSDAPPSATLSLIASLKDNEAKAGLLKSCSVLSSESDAGEDISRANCTLSLGGTSENSNAELCGSAQFDACTFSSDSGCSHYRSDDFDYSGMETVELSEKVKLEESCVMVDSSALYAVAQRTQKLGSFKKRIKDAFASKKRLAKEYEQLAIWFGDCYIGPSQELAPALLPSTTITSTVDLKDSDHISDSEWELL
ncbi:uncharacterized protein LOC123206172 isoform X1 [Mangifera indica]|uniref:uncharacterized protein LOC123206172 isoform X1 n=1 Tax=Mangifera indica TaxID=29780 RepID=UPI001CFADBFB|nr:uncharacterized protein LOC123206172 isoform X1 [Mangifera indica]XP_044479242.1 uncharacterized protein LOC123206172 isoform X1 [Mangifera indica]